MRNSSLYLEDMTPVLALVVHALVQDFHDLEELLSVGNHAGQTEIFFCQGQKIFLTRSKRLYNAAVASFGHLLVEGCSSQFVHLSSTRAPWVVRGRLSDFALDISVSLGKVFAGEK